MTARTRFAEVASIDLLNYRATITLDAVDIVVPVLSNALPALQVGGYCTAVQDGRRIIVIGAVPGPTVTWIGASFGYTRTVTYPAGTQVGDVAVFTRVRPGGAEPPLPPGWILQSVSSGIAAVSDPRPYWTHTVDVGDTGFTYTLASSGYDSWQLHVFRNASVTLGPFGGGFRLDTDLGPSSFSVGFGALGLVTMNLFNNAAGTGKIASFNQQTIPGFTQCTRASSGRRALTSFVSSTTGVSWVETNLDLVIPSGDTFVRDGGGVVVVPG